jgi:hypothetical protein
MLALLTTSALHSARLLERLSTPAGADTEIQDLDLSHAGHAGLLRQDPERALPVYVALL